MDSHTFSALGRLEVVETGRRRRWSEDEKVRIVLESMAAPRLVSATARRYGISRSLLITWRRALGAEPACPAATPGLVPAVIVPDPPAPSSPCPAPSGSSRSNGRMVIVLPRGRRVIVDADVDAEALARVLDVLEQRP